jgi:alpha-N-arabinofuranosidase
VFFLVVLLPTGFNLNAQNTITVYANKPTVEISKTMWGIFFEDINFAADGGLYPTWKHGNGDLI